jgi:hypothetical protein
MLSLDNLLGLAGILSSKLPLQQQIPRFQIINISIQTDLLATILERIMHNCIYILLSHAGP